jgi:hypothetical protein
MARPLDTLSLLVLETICEFLSTIDPKRLSLSAFALTSKACREAADRELFRDLHIKVEDPEELEEAITRWEEILAPEETLAPEKILVPCKRTRHVRRITITTDEWQFKFEDIAVYHEPMGITDADLVSRVSAKKDRVWRHLERFIHKCKGLKNLVWASKEQLPRCILEVLHNDLEECRLHIDTFDFSSLHQKFDQLHDVSDDEYAIARSDSLSSLRVRVTFFDSWGNLVYNKEAVARMVRGLARNLEHVWMFYHEEIDFDSRPQWRGFFENEAPAPQESLGRLKGLALRGNHAKIPVQDWAEYTDFTKLRSLELEESGRSGLGCLVDMAESSKLGNLRKLTLKTHHNVGDQQDWISALNRLISRLPPLESLDIQSDDEIVTSRRGESRRDIGAEVLATIAQIHGSSLTKLHLGYPVDHQELNRLREACPKIRDIGILVKRTHGDQAEVKTYQLLGSFPRLERLTLTLDYEDRNLIFAMYVEGPNFIDWRTQRMSSALINSAIDERLARSIFQVVFAANRASHPDTTPPFEHLTLTSTKLSWPIETHLDKLQNLIGCHWVCERVRADKWSDDAIVQEINLHRRLQAMKEAEEVIENEFRETYAGMLQMPLRPAWEAVWPEARGVENWTEIWRSFPLADVE